MQHDDHVWLMAGGKGWAIERIEGDLIFLWRGYYPLIERTILDVSNVDWEWYTQEAVRLLDGKR